MKKSISLIATVFTLLPTSAQEIITFSTGDSLGHQTQTAIFVDDIERIAWEGNTERQQADIVTVHLKDGTTYRGTNSRNSFSSFMLLDTNPHDNVITDTIRYLNNYETVWNVNGVAKKEGHYSVAVYWKGFQRSGLVNERGGICIGTTPNLTMENNEFMVYAKRISSYTNSYYVIMGDKPCLPMKFYTEQQNISFDDNGRQILSSSPIPFTITESPASFQSVKFMEENWVNMPLEYGKTYYYRTFKQGDVMHNGELKTVTIYDVEKSFRVPRVMEDAGYTPTIITDEAIAAFPSNFPEGVTVPKWEEIKPLWDIWQETDEGKQAISKGDVTTEAFDNGTGYRLNRIPDTFYNWLTNREVVIDAFSGLKEIEKTINNLGDSIDKASPEYVTDVDEKWGVPGNKYIRFKPTTYAINYKVTYHSSEVIPGVHYKLLVYFAPETEEIPTSELCPTKVRIIDARTNTAFIKSQEVSAKEVTTIEVGDVSTTESGLDIQIQTNVRNYETLPDYEPQPYNRVMRIAEMRLIPVK